MALYIQAIGTTSKIRNIQRARRVGCGEPSQAPEENACAFPPGNPIAPPKRLHLFQETSKVTRASLYFKRLKRSRSGGEAEKVPDLASEASNSGVRSCNATSCSNWLEKRLSSTDSESQESLSGGEGAHP